jgi:hypothetical protein
LLLKCAEAAAGMPAAAVAAGVPAAAVAAGVSAAAVAVVPAAAAPAVRLGCGHRCLQLCCCNLICQQHTHWDIYCTWRVSGMRQEADGVSTTGSSSASTGMTYGSDHAAAQEA